MSDPKVEGKQPVLSYRGASTLGIIAESTLSPNIHLLVLGGVLLTIRACLLDLAVFTL